MASFLRAAGSAARLGFQRFSGHGKQAAEQQRGMKVWGYYNYDGAPTPDPRTLGPDFVTYAGLTLRRERPYEYYISRTFMGFVWFWLMRKWYLEWDEHLLTTDVRMAHMPDNVWDDELIYQCLLHRPVQSQDDE